MHGVIQTLSHPPAHDVGFPQTLRENEELGHPWVDEEHPTEKRASARKNESSLVKVVKIQDNSVSSTLYIMLSVAFPSAYLGRKNYY